MLKHDRKRELLFAALDSNAGRKILAKHPEVRGFDSVLYVAPSSAGETKVFAHSSAALEVAAYLGGRWRLLGITRVIPTAIRDAVYRFVARHRHKLPGTRPQCVVPSAQERARFLD